MTSNPTPYGKLFLESNQENANGVLGFILNYALEWWPF
jgi:hypothetical protein